MHRSLVVAFLAAAALLVIPGLAAADSSSTLTVVGTSDVSDSGLMQNVVQPMFMAKYPQFTFKYIGTATGTAIASAEKGTDGASALIVHAASLENQFVGGGFSFANRYGYAIWTNDFVLAGPTGDPARVAKDGAHNVVQAFADIAAAGMAGRATFVSRGGTPGTTVEEHSLWALVASSHLEPRGLDLCAVSATLGGGETPIASSSGVADGAPCPNNALPTGSALPSWYVTTGLTQGPNVISANACTFSTGANTCYVLTDRGTFDFLASGQDPAGSIPGLKIQTRGPQAKGAPGGANALINYFHAYVINPSKVPNVNLTAAQDFVNMLTSPALQSKLKNYLNHTSDPGGAPFVASAAPMLTAGFPKSAVEGKKIAVKGTLVNSETGYPALKGQMVSLERVSSGKETRVAKVKTGDGGKFTINFKPAKAGKYLVSTGQLSVVEDRSLNPVFGDVLQPAATKSVRLKFTKPKRRRRRSKGARR